MRLHRPAARTPAESIIPMINVVFLLLIFFLMVAEIAPPETLKVTPPAAAGGAPPARGPVLELAPDGTPGFRGATGAAALQALGAVLAASPAATLRVRADRHAPAAALARLLPRLAALGAQEIHLVTVPE